MSIEDAARRIIEENRKAREDASDRFSRLIDVTVTGDNDEFTRVVKEVTEVEDRGASSEERED